MAPEPLVEAPAARRVFRDLFQEFYGVAGPVLPLGCVLHWADVVRCLGLAGTSVDQAMTSILGGYFYNTSTPVPTTAEIEEHLERGRARGVHQFLVPTVRNLADAGPLQTRGFRCIPWVVEAIFELREGLDADLLAELGRRRYKNIKRDVRRAAVRYPARFYERADLEADPHVLETAAVLHECNVRKYGHARNFYSAPLLRRLCASALGEHLLICIRRDEDTGEPVQASISLIDRRRGQLYQLVHGIFRERVAPGYNLFVADTYEVCAFAERHGIREINLGRGGQEEKRRLGANRFILLNNWLLNPSPAAASELEVLAARCRELLGLAGQRNPMIGAYRLE